MGMLLEPKHDKTLERSPFFGLEGNQFPFQCIISCIISLETTFFGAAKVLQINLCVFLQASYT